MMYKARAGNAREGNEEIEAITEAHARWTYYLGPAPYSNIVMRFLTPTHIFLWQKNVVLESRLAALEYGLRWKIADEAGTALLPATDPMTGKAFHVQTTPHHLIIGGGQPEVGSPNSQDRDRFPKYKLARQCLYVVEIRRLPREVAP